ncbi:UDP-glucose 4-epimerase GalE [Thalassorhabdomicrobium marinisediminis]|uniref:UDP-glucose 4-epimerase n=1 Tax=Thalassorhabdomicrobium marinisediminis TaxID=2170577 RepID=A0A2T7G067_9RHOB|nr:UDP-glucose 4-epimerase GalE [Thalassorhabdomicrobium marinisediminis]PVA07795.1 UDP-glucose 4-epimerase GalE [Thalassorhabdomicrobium marinisediminis]
MAKILLTGGAGYIGSHTYLALLEAGFEVVVFDNFSNAKPDVPDRLQQIAGQAVHLVRGDVLDRAALDAVFADHQIDGVVHFAAKKAVGESVAQPIDYMHTNIGGLLTLLAAMEEAGVRRLVFSSSATVYGDTEVQPIPEDHPRTYTSPYAYTKIAGEQILEQLPAPWAIGILRYFNPVGAHRSALIGEDPADIPNNLVPYIAKVATGELSELGVFGDDYNTPDGTGVRDYIHVEDLARGHVLSLQALLDSGKGHTVNLGTGEGSSVLEVVAAYSDACGRALPYRIQPRRDGDVAVLTARPEKARELLGFEATRSLSDMCRSSWAWVSGQIRNARD